MDPDKLLLKISLGKHLSNSELEEIVNFLNGVDVEAFCKSTFIDDVYSYILVLSKTDNKKFHYVLEKFLHVNDPLTVALTIETLCIKWNLFPDYMERIFDFSLGVAWDSDNDLRNTAIRALCHYLSNSLKDNALDKHGKRVVELLESIYAEDELEMGIREEISDSFLSIGHEIKAHFHSSNSRT